MACRNAVVALEASQSSRFRAVDKETQEILKSLTDVKMSLKEDLEKQSRALVQLLSRQDVIVESTAPERVKFVVNVYNPVDIDLEC